MIEEQILTFLIVSTLFQILGDLVSGPTSRVFDVPTWRWAFVIKITENLVGNPVLGVVVDGFQRAEWIVATFGAPHPEEVVEGGRV